MTPLLLYDLSNIAYWMIWLFSLHRVQSLFAPIFICSPQSHLFYDSDLFIFRSAIDLSTPSLTSSKSCPCYDALSLSSKSVTTSSLQSVMTFSRSLHYLSRWSHSCFMISRIWPLGWSSSLHSFRLWYFLLPQTRICFPHSDPFHDLWSRPFHSVLYLVSSNLSVGHFISFIPFFFVHSFYHHRSTILSPLLHPYHFFFIAILSGD